MKTFLFFSTSALLAALPMCAEGSAKERADKLYNGCPNIVRDLQYKQVPGFTDPEQLSMDLILPEKDLYKNGAPVVMYIHGGGWSGGERYVLGKGTFRKYTDKGIAVACISYRLAKNGHSALDCLIDCKDAARFLAKHAEKYKLDPTRFAVRGHSAGAHLALCTGLAANSEPVLRGDPTLADQNPIFRCALGEAPQCTLFNPEEADSPGTISMKASGLEKILGGKSPAQPSTKQMASNAGRKEFIYSIKTKDPIAEVAKVLSPDLLLSRKSTPALVIHGTTDTLISVRGAQYFKKIADKCGSDVQYVQVENAWHNFLSRDPSKTPSHTRKKLEDIGFRFILDKLLKGIKKK